MIVAGPLESTTESSSMVQVNEKRLTVFSFTWIAALRQCARNGNKIKGFFIVIPGKNHTVDYHVKRVWDQLIFEL